MYVFLSPLNQWLFCNVCVQVWQCASLSPKIRRKKKTAAFFTYSQSICSLGVGKVSRIDENLSRCTSALKQTVNITVLLDRAWHCQNNFVYMLTANSVSPPCGPNSTLLGRSFPLIWWCQGNQLLPLFADFYSALQFVFFEIKKNKKTKTLANTHFKSRVSKKHQAPNPCFSNRRLLLFIWGFLKHTRANDPIPWG